ncbi:hypothetical protein FOL46_005817 [Perkinsus olseni]|uniref:Uncharacterized protein n=1 Tax=Perkinsus olseni TaxID=32597 RepID=A0A7J6MRA9_PEROL|nr:hypothetical protein FOL46_005817 [Perkinsus olseni]
MAPRIIPSRLLTVTALLVSPSYQASGSLRSERPMRDRKVRTFHDNSDKTMTETVIGYAEDSSGEFHVMDVAHLEYPYGNNSYVEFTVLADEAALESSDNAQIEGLLMAMDTGEENPTRSVVSEMFEKYEKNFVDKDEMFCTRQATSEVWTVGGTCQLSIRYTIYLSKANLNQPFKLRALKAELATNSKQCEWIVKPKFNANKFNELLSRSKSAIPRGRDTSAATCSRQVEYYSNYVSPPGGNAIPDTWPYTVKSSSYPLTTGQQAINVFHWLSDGSMQFEH